MKRTLPPVLLAVAALGAAGCSGGSSSGGSTGTVTPPATGNDAIVLTAGTQTLQPATAADVASGVDLSRLGVQNVSAVYDFTTPAGEAFALNAFSRAAGNSGAVRVSLAHALDGGATPGTDPTSLGLSGLEPIAPSLLNREPWVDSEGDGFARLTLGGAITQDQVYALQAQTPAGLQTILLRLRIGAPSRINVERQTVTPAPFVIEERTLYSSDSWRFGLPTVATSGDRTTVVVYEGDEGDRHSPKRYQLRLQYDRGQGSVTGGASEERDADTGNWRDHEIAALFNVLAVLDSGEGAVEVRLSFDRGATFGQMHQVSAGGFNGRLIQAAFAADYTLACLFWRTGPDFSSELVLVEGRPSKTDSNGSPTEFDFDAPVVIERTSGDVTPVIMGAQYSSGGDLVVGYGYSVVVPNPDAVETKSQFRCATRIFGETDFTNTLVEELVSFSYDPSVALRGSGQSLEILYAYEAANGVRLAHSSDAGQSFSAPVSLGDDTAHMPTVLLREQGGAARADVVYLQRAPEGNELHVAHWDDFDLASAPNTHRLSEAFRTPGAGSQGMGTTTSVAWLGYDATLEGDDVVVVFQEQTYDFVTCLPMPMPAILGQPTLASAPQAAGFTPATPPPLAPGLTTPLPTPDPAHRNQLKLIRLD